MHELIDELPVANDVLNKMDKAAVIKLAISYIKIKHFVQKGWCPYHRLPFYYLSTIIIVVPFIEMLFRAIYIL